MNAAALNSMSVFQTANNSVLVELKREERSCQRIVRKIRAVNRALKRRRPAKVIKVVSTPEAVKVSNKADNKVAGPANVAAKTAKTISVRRGEFGSLISDTPRPQPKPTLEITGWSDDD